MPAFEGSDGLEGVIAAHTILSDVDGVAGGLVHPRRDGEIHRCDAAGGVEHERGGARPAVQGRLAAVIVNGRGAGARVDDVRAAAAVDRIRA